MTIAVTVQTSDRPAEVFAFTFVEGMPLDRSKMVDFGRVPPNSEMEFAMFADQDILVRHLAPRSRDVVELTRKTASEEIDTVMTAQTIEEAA
ncbi:MAG: hypothetical protein AAFQ13_01865 [Pseudomonadota bacterium]